MDREEEQTTKNIVEYENLLQTIWREGVGIIGEPALRFIFDASIRKVSCLFEFIKYIKINANRIYFTELDKNNVSKESKEEIEKGLQTLLSEILTSFNILWDDIIIEHLLSHIFKDKKDFL